MNSTKLKKNKPLLFQSFGRLSMQGLGFLFSVIIVRVSGIELMGQFAKYNALLNISFGVLASGLYINYLRNNNVRLLGQTLVGITTIFILFLIIAIPIYVIFTGDSILNIIFILSSFYFMKLSDIYIATTRFTNKDVNSIMVRVVPYLTIIALCLIFKPKNISLLLFFVSLGWLSVLYFIFNIKEQITLTNISLNKIFTSSIILSLSTLATQINANFDQLMIVKLLDYNQLGYYKIGYSFSALVMPLVGVFSFFYISENKNTIQNTNILTVRRKFYNQMKINFTVSFLFFIFCCLFLKKIIFLVYKIDNNDSANVGIILSLAIIFNVLNIVISYSLLSINKEKIVLLISLLGSIINISLNYFFISKYGAIGGAWTSVVTQLFVFLIFLYFFYFRINYFKHIKKNMDAVKINSCDK